VNKLVKTFDLIVKNARLPDADGLVDIAIKDDKILMVEKGIKANSKKRLDVKGNLTSAGFIDAHMHLDHAFVGGDDIWNGRTLAEAAKIVNRRRQALTPEEFKSNARKAAEMALINGSTALRTHVSLDQIAGLRPLNAILELKKECSDWMDIQVVAFNTELPLTSFKIGESLLRQGMSSGADIVGGLPYRDPKPEKYFDIIFDVAKEFNADIDLHVDETNDPKILTLETYAEKTLEYGYEGKVAASHCCSLSAVSEKTAKRVIKKVRDAKMSIIANPITNLYLQGSDGNPNGVTRVRELLDAGVNVIYGTDNTRDAFNPLGTADMLCAALFLAYYKHLDVKNPLKKIFEMSTSKAAEATKIVPNYGIRRGGKADLVVFDAETPEEAIMKQSRRLYVIKNGKIVLEKGILKL